MCVDGVWYSSLHSNANLLYMCWMWKSCCSACLVMIHPCGLCCQGVSRKLVKELVENFTDSLFGRVQLLKPDICSLCGRPLCYIQMAVLHESTA